MGFFKIAQSIPNKAFGSYAKKLESIDKMVEASSSLPPQSDNYFRERQQRIEQMPEHQRHEAYELLLGFISNNRGFADPMYDEIAEHANRNSLRKG